MKIILSNTSSCLLLAFLIYIVAKVDNIFSGMRLDIINLEEKIIELEKNMKNQEKINKK